MTTPTPPPGMQLLPGNDYDKALPKGAKYSPDGENWYASGNIGGLPFPQHIYAIPITHPIETKTPEEWCKITGTIILDPDGWRFGARGFGDGSWSKPKSWEEPISLEEFRARTSVSTQMLKRPITHPATGDAKPVEQRPIPKPLFPCKHCYEFHTWPAEDLHWSETEKGWVCLECWDLETHGDHGSSLQEEIDTRK